jgi:hypothetical protein
MHRCVNCQSNFRLKVFLLFLTPTVVSLFVYSFFCFLRASILPDFLNWLFTLPPLRMLPHTTLCSSICVSASVIQHLCFNIYISAYVIQHMCFSICDSAYVFQHLRFSICDSAFVFQHLHFSICDSAYVFQHLRFSICDSAFVFQHFSFYVPVSLVRVVNLDCFITDCHQ